MLGWMTTSLTHALQGTKRRIFPSARFYLLVFTSSSCQAFDNLGLAQPPLLLRLSSRVPSTFIIETSAGSWHFQVDLVGVLVP